MRSGSRQSESQRPFARAYDLLTMDRNLSAAEKLVMIQVCRYWPRPCTMTAARIARLCGLDSRYVRNIVKGLCQGAETRVAAGKKPRKAYLRRKFVHVKKRGVTSTCRVLVPLCLSSQGAPLGALSASGSSRSAPMDPVKRAYEPTPSAPIEPPNRTQNRKKVERGSSPVSAIGKTSTSQYGPLRNAMQVETVEGRERKREEIEEELRGIEAKLKVS